MKAMNFDISLRKVYYCFILFYLFSISQCSSIYASSKLNKYKKVTKINLSHKRLKEIPSSVFDIPSLEILILHHNDIAVIPKEIIKLKNLKKLVLSRNEIVNVPSFIGELENLKQLSLKANRIQILPESLGKLTNLQILNLGFNRLIQLPDSIGNLSSLYQLSVGYNDLQQLPKSLGRLEQIREIYLNENQLIELPDTFYSLGLYYLNLYQAGPELAISEEICKMRQLESLIIDMGTYNFLPRCLSIRASNNSRFSIIVR